MTAWEPGDRIPDARVQIYRRELFQVLEDATCHPRGCQCYLTGGNTQPDPKADITWPWLKDNR